MKYVYAAFSFNLIFSAACGLVATTDSVWLSDEFLHIHPLIIQVVGVGLWGFAGLITYYLIKGPTIPLGRFIVLQDLLWIVITCVIALAMRDTLQSEGIKLVMLISLYVLTVMVLQYLSLTQLTRHAPQ